MRKWKLPSFLLVTAFFWGFLSCNTDKSVGPKDDEGNPQITVPTAPPSAEGIGELTMGEDIVSTPIPAGAQFNTPVVQEFVELFMAAISGGITGGASLGKAAQTAGTSLRKAMNSQTARVYVVGGDVYGGVRVVHDKAGNIQTGNSEFESIANEFFDFSNAEGLYLGGSAGYLISKTKNTNGNVTTTERANGTIRFNGVFRGEIVFENVVITNDVLTGGVFQLRSGTAVIDLPVYMLGDFIFSQDFPEAPLPPPAFVAVRRISVDVPTTARAGDALVLLASVSPFDATNRRITYTVTGASLNASAGTVTFNQVGTATIKATIVNGRSATADYVEEWDVRVVAADAFVAVEEIRFSIPRNVEQNNFLGFDLYPAAVLPANATNRQITWTAEGATLRNANGTITGILFDTLGRARVTAVVANGEAAGRDYEQSWNVSVFERGDLPPRDTIPRDTIPRDTIPRDTIPAFIPVDSIALDIPQTVLTGTVSAFNAAVTPATATNQLIEWTVSPAAIGTISGANIRWLAAGDATVTATIANGIFAGGVMGNYTQSWTVTVEDDTPPIIPVDSIVITHPQEVQAGTQSTFSVRVYPENATHAASLTVEVAPDTVGRLVQSSGTAAANTIQWLAAGSATISASVGDETGGMSAVSLVRVLPSAPAFVPVTGITFNLPETVTVQSVSPINAVVLPENATNRQIQWTISPETAGRVTPNGIQWITPGEATVSAAIQNGTAENQHYGQTWTVTVLGGGDPTFVPVDSIVMPHRFPPNAQLNQQFQIQNPQILPQNATNRDIVWSAQNAAITQITGTASGSVVIFDRAGTATITATIANGALSGGVMGAFTQSWTVTVGSGGGDTIPDPTFVPVTEITNPGIPQTVQPGSQIIVRNFTITPANATARNDDVVWSVIDMNNNPFNGAQVQNNATIILNSAAAPGTSFMIVATIPDGTWAPDGNGRANYTQSWTVTVQGGGDNPNFTPVTGIEFSHPETVTAGTQSTFSAAVQPATATNRTIQWTVSPATVGHAISTGNIFNWLSVGQPTTATITATIRNGLAEGQDFTRSWPVTVLPSSGGGDPTFVPVDTIFLQLPPTTQLNQQFQLRNAQILPADATNRSIVWTAVNATVTQVTGTTGDFMVVFNTPGEATIRATIASGALEDGVIVSYTQFWTVTVQSGGDGGDPTFVPVTNIQLNTATMPFPQQVQMGTTTTVLAQIAPQNALAQVRDIQWTSSPSGAVNIQQVSGTNNVQFTWNVVPAAGPVTIVATIPNGGENRDYTQEWTVNLTPPSGGGDGGDPTFVPVQQIMWGPGGIPVTGGVQAGANFPNAMVNVRIIPEGTGKTWQDIIWTVTGAATLNGGGALGVSFDQGPGTAMIMARIPNGEGENQHYMQTWEITVNP